MGSSASRWLPGVDVIRRYERSWFRHDLLAGFVLTALLIPAGIGYAQVAGLPPQAGLYATVVPLLAYALVGPSRILVLGPDSAIAPIIAVTVLPLAAGDSGRAVALAGLLALLMGAILVIGGLVHLGFVTDLLSKPIRIGYLNGIAVVVIVGQVPKLLGFSVDATTLIGRLRGLFRGIADGEINGRAAVIGLGALVVAVALRHLDRRVPAIAVAVIGSGVLTALLGWEHRLAVVGALPGGLPRPTLGGLRWHDVVALAVPALGIALIAFADTGVLSRTFAARHGEAVDGSEEMAAIGLANIAGGLFGGFPVSASATRTPVAEQAGARTQLAGAVGAIVIVGFVLVAPGLTGHVPTAALAAVVIIAAASLVDVPGLVWLARVSPIEAALSMSALLGVTLVGVLPGIAIAIGLSLLAFVNHAWRPYRTELGLRPGVRGYHDRARHPDAQRLHGIVIVRFDAPLFFANGGIFDHFVRSAVDVADLEGSEVHTVILAAEPITNIDATAIDELVELDDFLRSRGMRLLIAENSGASKRTMTMPCNRCASG